MLKMFSKTLTLLLIYSASLCQGDGSTCTLDHDQVLNENGVEVDVKVGNAINTGDNDGYLSLDFQEGKFENLTDIKAWCVDLGRPIGAKTYEVDVLSSLDADVTNVNYTDAIDKPEYLPSVNFLINTHPSGSLITIDNCTENHNITDQELQLSIWNITDYHDDPDSFWQGETDQCVVDYLVSKGKSNQNFEPDCTDPNALIGLLVIVDDDDQNVLKQTLLAEVPLVNTSVCVCGSDGGGETDDGGGERDSEGGGRGGEDRLNGAFGDPHFKTWAGEQFDFHGVCDLMLIKNSEFDNGLGMDIQIRSTRMGVWSYISKAAIRIGEDILEIVGGRTDKEYWINGIPGEKLEGNNLSDGIILKSTLSGFAISYKKESEKQRELTVELGKGNKIVFSIWNSFIGVRVKKAMEEHFQNSVGLMGSFPEGLKLARDNVSIIESFNSFGQEWQVLDSEPNLFVSIEGPQHPQKCEIPSSLDMRRRLEESAVTIKEATKACANVNVDVMDFCVFDVIATNNKLSAGAY